MAEDLSNWMASFKDKVDQKAYDRIFSTLTANQFTSRLQLKLLRSDQVDMMLSSELSMGAKTLLLYQLDLLKEKSPLPVRTKPREERRTKNGTSQGEVTQTKAETRRCVLPALQEQENKVKEQLDKEKANRKFVWSALYNYDVQFRLNLTINTTARFDTVNTTLYTTILDSSAIRKEGISCQRCKSPNHLVRDCLFRAKTALEENQSAKKISPRTCPDSGQQTYTWKYEKWFTSNGKEGCNLFQRNSCHQGTE
ncbi:hypothetical protein ACROYT_G012560 [Oculina patagonica]